MQDFLHPDRVVVGDLGDWAGNAVVELYRPLLQAAHGGHGEGALVRTDVASAEMVKLASNAFLATKISFINEIANVCEETGADVVEVARGMGLDARIGPKFLQAGIGYGGSYFAPEETVLTRQHGRTSLMTYERGSGSAKPSPAERSAAEEAVRACGSGASTDVLEPAGLEVLSWVRGEEQARFLPVMALTRRPYEGEMLEVRTKMGRRVLTTLDHPWIVGDGERGKGEVKLAFELTEQDWVPLAGLREEAREASGVRYPLDAAIEAAGLVGGDIIVRPPRAAVEELVARPFEEVTLRMPEAELHVAWARISALRRERYSGYVYSLEVPYSHTVVTSGGVITSNCFPKDVDALKQLAGNSGYHFQLLTAVIEVNELQKRRVDPASWRKPPGQAGGRAHRRCWGSRSSRTRTRACASASSLVLAARLNAAEGAHVQRLRPDRGRSRRCGLHARSLAAARTRRWRTRAASADAVVLVTELAGVRRQSGPGGEVAAGDGRRRRDDGRNASTLSRVRAARPALRGNRHRPERVPPPPPPH